MAVNADRVKPRQHAKLQRRKERLAVGFLVVMAIALVTVGYFWIQARQDRQSLSVYSTDLSQ
ncbi:MAG: hypothetical protein AB7F76_08050 [Parvibaculaceae bacterium]